MTLEEASTKIKNLKLVEKCRKFNEEFSKLKKPKIRSIGHHYYEKFFGEKYGIFNKMVCSELGITRPITSAEAKKPYGDRLDTAIIAVIKALKNSINESIEFAEKRVNEIENQLNKQEKDEVGKQVLENEKKLYFDRVERLNPLKEDTSKGADFSNTLKKVVSGAYSAYDDQFAISLGAGIAVLGYCITLSKLIENKKSQLNGDK